MRAVVTLVVSVSLGLVTAPAATASSLGTTRTIDHQCCFDGLEFVAGPGELNRLTITATRVSRLTMQVSDSGGAIGRLFGRCAPTSPNAASCPMQAQSLNAIWVALGDGDDSAWVTGTRFKPVDDGSGDSTTLAFNVIGGSGDDALTEGAHSEAALLGGSGNDRLRSGPDGVDVIRGGPGNDVIAAGSLDLVEGGPGNDTIAVAGRFPGRVNCGPGVDTVRAAPRVKLVQCERVIRAR